MDVDQAYEKIGQYGKLQRKLFWALAIFNIYQAFHQVHMLYIGAVPHFKCISKTGTEFDGCANGTTCSSYWYSNEFTSVVTEWDLVCKNGYRASLTQSFIFAGIMIGCMLCGPLSDKYGRYRVFTVCVAAFTLLATISVFSTSYWMFTILRFLTGIFNGGAGLVQFVLTMELIGASWRNYCGNIMPALFSIGIFVFSLMAYLIRPWRILSLCTALPGFLFVTYYYFKLPESPRWLLTQNRISDAETVIHRIARGNNADLTNKRIRLRAPPIQTGRSYNVMDIFRHRILRHRTIVQIYAWFVNSVVYYGLTMSAGNLGGNLYLSISLSGLVELPAYFMAAIVLDRLGRKIPFSTFMIIGGAACLAILVIPTSNTVVKTCLALLGKIAISASFSIAYIYSAELYPTVIRNNGMSVCTVATRLGGIVAPLVIPLDYIYPSLSFLVYGSLSFTAGLIALQLPETHGEALPESIEDLSPASTIMTRAPEFRNSLVSDDRVRLLEQELEEEETKIQS